MTFEAAARLKSFTRAARELNVSQAAVSRQIRLLEDDFGEPLFKRGHRRVETTFAGDILGVTLNRALDMISETVDSLRSRQGIETLTIGSTVAFSYFWLLPRLTSFNEKHPGLKIRVVSQDEPFDLRANEVDVVIWFGIPPFLDGKTVKAVSDKVFPVASPGFATRFRLPLHPDVFQSMPLIGTDVSDPSWMTWQDWFERVDPGAKNPPIGLQFNHYTDAIAAAIAGQGVALGWNLILADFLAKGQLVRLAEPIDSEATYNVLVPKTRRTSEATESFIKWLESTFP
jgi:DNA-binding transcriptional LysR family regulator